MNCFGITRRVALVWIAVVFAALAAPMADDEMEVTALAMVGDRVITSLEVDNAARPEIAALPASLSAEERQKAISEIRRYVLDSMIEYELAYMEFKAMGAKIPQDVIQDRINSIIKEKTNGDIEAFDDALFRENITQAEFMERVRKDMAVEAYVYERVRKNVHVLDSEIEKYAATHSDEDQQPARYHVQVIALKKDGKFAENIEETEAAIRQKLADGADFLELAAEYSENAVADLGWQEEMAPKLQAVADTLSEGQVAPSMLDMGKSLYLVKLAGFVPAQATGLSPEYREKIRRILAADQEKKRYRDCFRELYLKYPVVRFAE